MAQTDFLNDDPSHVAGLGFNPGIEDVLDPNGTITTIFGPGAQVDMFAIKNASGGPFNGFEVRLFGTDFTFNGNSPTGGNIGWIVVYAPDGQAITNTTGTLGDPSLFGFYYKLTHYPDPVFAALNALLDANQIVEGSDIADHATSIGSGNFVSLAGRGGDDVLWFRDGNDEGTLIGGAGNDILRVGDGDFSIHGGEYLGPDAPTETNTLELYGEAGSFTRVETSDITNINVLRFVDANPPVFPAVEGANIELSVYSGEIGPGTLSLTLAVEGSTIASPYSSNRIDIWTPNDPSATTAVNLDLSGWTFTNWDNERASVQIGTNASVALNDSIIGTSVRDFISGGAGDDTLRGGKGADSLYGESGNDVFVYSHLEAEQGERVYGDSEDPASQGFDRLLLLGSNDFKGVSIRGIEQIEFQDQGTGLVSASFDQWSLFDPDPSSSFAGPITIVGDASLNFLVFELAEVGGAGAEFDLSTLVFESWTKKDDIRIIGTFGNDDIIGSTQNDLITGGWGGRDTLEGGKGADTFYFEGDIREGRDHIVDFSRKEGDGFWLNGLYFDNLKVGKLKKSAFTTGTKAKDDNDRIIYDKHDGVLRYDWDGEGGKKAKVFAEFDDPANLKAADFFVV